ncbi:hypothetical protein Enr13x_23380 [Stieleria neptunia]|uniref:Uncharacterized protein n=1 Tax=Stieleria neptunia TaxID=2527979 RepID=A0A518HNR7_9BACT|nr:hypothetical protein [Stieleria neptunia]QDV42490.1 hypothetical protein Enr13x_23380 [Stieleria neptunia]
MNRARILAFVALFLALPIFTGCGGSDYDRGYEDAKKDMENSDGILEKFSTGWQAGQGNPHESDDYNSGYYRAVTEQD